jgi:serine/threonine-protein kinase
MSPGMINDPDAVSRFNREASNASQINHPNVAAIYDFGETAEGLIYLAMEFVDGDPLSKMIERHRALPAPRAAEITRQAAEALGVAHACGIVHRDLKPDNIMIGKGRQGADLVKVVDFGIAKAAASDEQKVTKTGMVVGTPEYMSPEQLSGDPLDARSDIYALALVTFNMLTGKLPFPGESMQETMIMRLTDDPHPLSAMKPDVSWPQDLQAVMDKALARNADNRYRNASEYAHDLVQAIDRMPVTSITTMGTEVLARISQGSAQNASAAGTEATVQVQVPKTRVATKDDAPLAAKPAASPAVTPTASKTPMFAGIGLIAAVAIGFAVWKGQSGGARPSTADTLANRPIAAANSTESTPPRTPVEEQGKSLPPALTPRQIAETDTVLAQMSDGVLTANDAEKSLILSKLEGLRSRLSTPDQRVLAAIVESMAVDSAKSCPPLRKISQNDLRAANAKTAGDFQILLNGCK